MSPPTEDWCILYYALLTAKTSACVVCRQGTNGCYGNHRRDLADTDEGKPSAVRLAVPGHGDFCDYAISLSATTASRRSRHDQASIHASISRCRGDAAGYSV